MIQAAAELTKGGYAALRHPRANALRAPRQAHTTNRPNKRNESNRRMKSKLYSVTAKAAAKFGAAR